MNYSNIFPENVDELSGKKAIFLLGTDQYIGEGLDEHGNPQITETRVGIIPEQVEAIKNWLELKGVALDFFFVKGAGTRAGFLDAAYLKIGGQALFENQLPEMPAPHVVHALKEPVLYETLIPGPFLRIGALHFGAFDDEKGIAFLFKKRNFCAIFDGSNVGTDKEKPIRGSMSVFAGEIAAENVEKHFAEKDITNAKVVISGGGVAGKAFLNKFLKLANDKYAEIIVVELAEGIVLSLKDKYASESRIKIIQAPALTAEQVKNANAVILTAVTGDSAPDVLMFNDIKAMSDNSIIVDISIDEKGGIVIPDFNRHMFDLSMVKEENSKAIESLGKEINYVADDHLPKYKPKPASIEHGAAVMPYIAMLLFYSAKLGGARQTAKYILDGDFTDQKDEKARQLLQHLKRGLVFYSPSPIKYNPIVTETEDNKTNMKAFFQENSIESEPM